MVTVVTTELQGMNSPALIMRDFRFLCNLLSLSVHRYVVWSVAEKDLVLEIDRLRHHAKNGTMQHGKRPKMPAGAVDTFITDLEDERDYWKRQVSELQ